MFVIQTFLNKNLINRLFKKIDKTKNKLKMLKTFTYHVCYFINNYVYLKYIITFALPKERSDI